MSNSNLIKTIERDGFTIEIFAVETHSGCNMLFDQFELTDRHEGGVTIVNPEHDHNSYRYAIPLQTSLAELTKSFAKQGRENPSREAYESLQKELGWYITADDCYLRYTVSKAGIELADYIGIGFDYSWHYSDQSLEDYALEILADYGDTEEALAEAKENLSALLEEA